MRLHVLYEDNHLLALNKPAGIATMGAAAGTPTLLDWARQYVKVKYHKPGNVYLGVVSRLDAPVTGVILLARTSKAADRLTRQFRDRSVKKQYCAIVSPAVAQPAGRLVNWLRKDETARRMVVCRTQVPDSQWAELTYRQLTREPQRSWLEIELLTGRKHQIRLQLSAIGSPVLGDTRYESRTRFPHGIALHAQTLELKHPVGEHMLHLAAPLPSYWPELPNH